MNSAERFLQNIVSVSEQSMPRAHKVVTGLIIGALLIAAAVLWFTPWIQTAFGQGSVDSMEPNGRMQAISALVDGQIKTWHVREGMKVKAGDPIVTLTDVDTQRIEKLQSQLAATKQRHEADVTAVENAQKNLARQKALLQQGLVSQRDVEAAQIQLESLRAKAASSQADITSVSMVLSRQETLTKVAPVDGTIVRLFAGGTATYVKAGDVLGHFIPDGVTRYVKITVSGLDAPLVKPGAKARIQFEGWPVIQFSGWPDTAVGTFGGEVEYVEPVANQMGAFQVWIKPDAEDIPWPSANVVRLGSRVRAWILLEEVRLGYELWRQLNNFPPQQTQQTQQTEQQGSAK